MAVRIQWDKYEAAILLDASLKVIQREIKRNEAIRQVSYMLRQKAINKGVVIDSVYRNENGISMQMTIMTALIQNKPFGLHSSSKLFSEMKELYQTNYEEYIQILREAKDMTRNSLKDDFYIYVRKNEPEKADEIVSALHSTNEFAIRTNILSHSIFDDFTIETYDILATKVLRNIFFTFKHKRIMRNVEIGLKLYADFIDILKNINNNYVRNSAIENVTNEDNINKTTECIDACTVQEFVLNFGTMADMSFTRPLRFEFCNELYNDFTNWTQLYTRFLELLYQTNQNAILSLCGKNIFGNGRIEITDTSQKNILVAPKSFADDLYVETNLSAKDITRKIHRLLEICGFSVADLKIYYEKKTSVETIASTTRTMNSVNRRSKNTPAKEDFFNYLINYAKLSLATARSYSSQINTSEKFATANLIGSGKLYNATSTIEACETAQLLLNSSEFLEFSRSAHNAPFAAVTKYYEYLTGSRYEGMVKRQECQEDFSDVDFERYKDFLLENYIKGFRLYDKLSLKRLRVQWQKTFDEELQYNDETICKHISHITIRHGDMAYLPQSLLDDETKERLLTYIETTFESGKSVIYYEALYKEFADDFSCHRINNVEMLKTYLTYINDGNMYLNRSYIAANKNVTVDHADEVRSYMISHGTSITFEELASALPHLPEDKIKWIISGNNSNEFVWNQKGEFFHADVVDLSQYELDLITEWISLSIADKEYMGGKELVDTIKQKLPSVMERYPFLTEYGLRDAIAYKLQNTFSFKGKIISALGQDLSMEKVFSEFASSNAHFTLTQLNSLKNDLNTPIYFDAVYQNSLRINKEEFVSPEQANFDVTATDAAIDRFCQGEYVSIKEISLFGAFPDAGFPWNEFLLQHYVANYSKSYKLLHAGFTAGYAVGAIVKRTSKLNTFEEAITEALADSRIALNSEAALQYLSDSGFLARRSYGNIEAVLAKANQQRLNKGE